jgi:hypothetical protein
LPGNRLRQVWETLLPSALRDNPVHLSNTTERRKKSLLELNTERECFRLLKMKAVVAKKAKNEAELLDQATGNLLRAVKQKIHKKQGRVDLSKLRKEGYSDRFLDKLERA